MTTESERLAVLEVKTDAQNESVKVFKNLTVNFIGIATATLIGFAAAVLFVNSQITGLEYRISAVENKLEDRITSVEQRIVAVEERIVAVEDQIVAVEEQVTEGFRELKSIFERIEQRLEEPVSLGALTPHQN